MKKINLLFVLVLVVLTYTTITAQFTSVQNGKWHWASTWSTDPNATAIPDSNDNVFVYHTINLDGGNMCNNLTVESSGHIYNGSVNVYGSLNNNGTIDGISEWYGMTIYLKGNLTNSGFYNSSTYFNGIVDQVIESSDTLFMDYTHVNNPNSKIILEGVTIFKNTNFLLHGSELEMKDSLILVDCTFDGGKFIGNNNVLLGVDGRLGWSGSYTFNPAHTELTNLYLEGSIRLYGSGEGIWGLTIGEGVVNNGNIINTYQHTGGSATIYIDADFINNGTIEEQQDGLFIIQKSGNFTNNGEMKNRNITFQNSHTFINNSDSLSVREFFGIDVNSAVTINKDLVFNSDVMINMRGGKVILSNSAILDNFGMENTILEANNSIIVMRDNAHVWYSTVENAKFKKFTIGYESKLVGDNEIIEDGSLYIDRNVIVEGNIVNNGTVTGRGPIMTGQITNNGIWKATTNLSGDFLNSGYISIGAKIEVTGSITNNGKWRGGTELIGDIINSAEIDSCNFNIEGTVTNEGDWNVNSQIGGITLIGDINNYGAIGGGTNQITGNINNEGSWRSYAIWLNGTEDQFISMPTDSVVFANYIYFLSETLGSNYQWFRNEDAISNENKKYLLFDNIGILPDNATYYCTVDGSNSRNIIIQSLTDVDNEKENKNIAELPTEYSISQNYPNPFNPSTVIEFAIPEKANVILKVFNSIGEEVATLVNQEMNAGYHSMNFSATNLSSGIYFYRISSGNFTQTNKMLLIK